MNAEVSNALTFNLNKMGVSLNHISYASDMLQALNDKLKSDKENVFKYSHYIA